MMTEKLPNEPSMDEILASIRKIISTDAQEPHSYFPHHEDILDLTVPLDLNEAFSEESESARHPLVASEIEDNREEEWTPPIYKENSFETQERNSQARPTETHSYGSTSAPSLEESLLSETTLSEASQAFHMLNEVTREQPQSAPSCPEARNQTLENLVGELLKPLLKEWLDAHLPALVRSIVTQQVEKIADQKRS